MTLKKFDYDNDVYDVNAIQNGVLLIKDRDLSNANIRVMKKIFAEEDCQKITFSHCSLSDLRFEEYTFSKGVKFENCDFYGKTLFTNCKINAPLDFTGSIFHNESRFENCEISSNIVFKKITTKPSCDFYFKENSVSENKDWVQIDLGNAHFGAEAVFNYLKGFILNFRNVIFEDKFYFTGTTFFIKSVFCGVQFPETKSPELKVCFQTLYKALLASDFDTEAETIKDYMKKFEKIMYVESESKSPPEKRIFSSEEAADYIGVKRATLDKWRSLGPKAKKQPVPLSGRPVRYTKEALDAYLYECKK